MSDADERALEQRLSAILPGSPCVSIRGAASLGAQRRTLFLELDDGGSKRRAVAQIASPALAATDVETEAALLRAVREAGVVVPEILAADGKLGAIVSEHVEGESIPRRILRRVEEAPERGARLTSDCAAALAKIHRIPCERFTSLPDLTAPERYADEMAQTLEALDAPHPGLRLGIKWLRRHADRTAGRDGRLVHGDFRLGNLLVDDAGLRAVLDWELAHRGDPMEDLAWLCLRTWRFGADDLEVGGFGRLAALREAYEGAGGEFHEGAFAWWTVARTLWWGLGLARQAKAFLDGQSRSIVLAASGRRVAELEYDLLRLIE